jgi:hypothetical protein
MATCARKTALGHALPGTEALRLMLLHRAGARQGPWERSTLAGRARPVPMQKAVYGPYKVHSILQMGKYVHCKYDTTAYNFQVSVIGAALLTGSKRLEHGFSLVTDIPQAYHGRRGKERPVFAEEESRCRQDHCIDMIVAPGRGLDSQGIARGGPQRGRLPTARTSHIAAFAAGHPWVAELVRDLYL